MTTTVSRRIINIKLKNRPRRAKLKREVEIDPDAPRSAAVPLAVPHAAAIDEPWWRDFLKPLPIATLLGVVAGIGLLIWSAGKPDVRREEAKAAARPATLSGSGAGTTRPAQAGSTVTTNGRSEATAESFLATGFVRRKVDGEPAAIAKPAANTVAAARTDDSAPIVLPSNASGNCDIVGDGSRSLIDCFRKHGGR